MFHLSSKTLDDCIECPIDGKVIRGICYILKRENTLTSWNKANDNCKRENSYLVNVNLNNWFMFWDDFELSFNQFNQQYYVINLNF